MGSGQIRNSFGHADRPGGSTDCSAIPPSYVRTLLKGRIALAGRVAYRVCSLRFAVDQRWDSFHPPPPTPGSVRMPTSNDHFLANERHNRCSKSDSAKTWFDANSVGSKRSTLGRHRLRGINIARIQRIRIGFCLICQSGSLRRIDGLS